MNVFVFQILSVLAAAASPASPAAPENSLLKELVEKGVQMPDGQVYRCLLRQWPRALTRRSKWRC